jgi:hypothetical protein
MAIACYRDVALHYCVDDLPSASVPGSRLQNILDCLRLGRPVTPLSLGFLQQQGLEALHRLTTGVLSYDRFLDLARTEQATRIEASTAARLAREAEECAREAEECARDAARQARLKLLDEEAEAARRARESDPKYIAEIQSKKLLARYGIAASVEPRCFARLMTILRYVDTDQRLSQDDFVWLSSLGENYFSNRLRAAYHRLEAEFFANEFKKTRDPWMAVNASGHYASATVPAMPTICSAPSTSSGRHRPS